MPTRINSMERLSLLIAGAMATMIAGCGAGASSPSDTNRSPAAASHPSRLATGDAVLRWPMPSGWTSRVFYGGLGADPVGLPVVVAANLRLPATIGDCESLIPNLGRYQVVVRIYDYGNSPLVPRPDAVSVIRPGPIRAVADNRGRVKGFARSRVEFAGHTLVVDISYGVRRPPAGVLRAVERFLGDAHPAT